MRQTVMILAIAGAVVCPATYAQTVQGSPTRLSTANADVGAADPASPPVSKAHRAMASFNSLLREAALQSQATQRAAQSTHPDMPPARPVAESRDAVASTPDPGAVH